MLRVVIGAIAGLLIGIACMRSLGLLGLIVSVIVFTGIASSSLSIPVFGCIIGVVVLLGKFVLGLIFMG